MFLVILNVLILAALGFIAYVFYYSFYVPEKLRRDSFMRLTKEQLDELKNDISAEHFFRLGGEIGSPLEIIKRRLKGGKKA